jgi:protein SCO1/2
MRTWLHVAVLAGLAAMSAGAQSGFLNPTAAEPPGNWENPAGSPVRELEGVSYDQLLEAQIDHDLEFTDSTGARVRLGDLFGEVPTVLSLVYYDCPMLCTLELNGLVKAMRPMSLDAGIDYRVITVSFDPRETPAMAAGKKDVYLRNYVHAGFYDREKLEDGWKFLVGDEANIKALTDAVGFHFKFDEGSGLYRHASGIVSLTPDGRVSRYQFGVEYSARDLKLALLEASQGKIGNLADAVMLYCFHYDPSSGKYGLVIMNVLRLGAALTVALLFGFIALSLLRDRRAGKLAGQGGTAV